MAPNQLLAGLSATYTTTCTLCSVAPLVLILNKQMILIELQLNGIFIYSNQLSLFMTSHSRTNTTWTRREYKLEEGGAELLRGLYVAVDSE